jgi:ankyrin repeat protein
MGSSKVPDLLLARGAQGMNLVTAASLGKLDLVRKFLDSGAPLGSLAARTLPTDHGPADSARMKGDVISDSFYGACRKGHTAVAAALLGRGADVNAKGVFGGTALHWAAINVIRTRSRFLWRTGPI